VTGSGTQSVAVGDFNGDRIPDLGVANSLGNSVSILLGKGAGSFELLDNVQVNDRPSNLVVLDVNGDGKTDIALPSWTTDSISILLNRF
jgi:hypothetical protein